MTIESIRITDIISQTLILFLLIALGYIFAKSKYLPDSTGVVLSKMVIKVSMPATILVKMVGANFTREDYINGVVLYFGAIIFLLATLGISFLLTRKLPIGKKTQNVYMIQSMFGNVSFFALPLFLVLFGERGVIYAMFFNMGNDTLLWSVGIFLINRHKEVSFKKNIRHMINANTIAFVIGILLMLTGINKYLVGNSVYKTVDMIAATTSPLSMLFIGVILAGVKMNFAEFKKKIPILILSVQRLILVPVLAILIFGLLKNLIAESVILIIALQLAMPIGTLTASLAMEYESDYDFATQAVFISTILSILTLPLISILLKTLLKFI